MPIIDNPAKFADKFRVKSSRLNNWDYSSNGLYFITICTLNHNNFFGKIINNKMELSKIGIITKQELFKTFQIRNNEIKLSGLVIMPNHIHMIIDVRVETHRGASLQTQPNYSIFIHTHKNNQYFLNKLNRKSNQTIPLLLKQFKSSVTREVRKQKLFFAWQTRYFDEIINSQKRLIVIKNYIKNNIENWDRDKLYSEL